MKDTVGWKRGIWLSPTLIQAWCHWRLCHLGLKGDRKKRWAAQTLLSKRFNNQEQEKKKERRATQLDREFPARILRWVGLPASVKKQGGPEWCWEVTPICQKPWKSLRSWWEPHLPTDPNGVRLPLLSHCGERFATSATAEGDWLSFSSVGFRVSTSLLSLFVRAGRLSSELWSLKVSKCYLLTAGGSQFRARKCTE